MSLQNIAASVAVALFLCLMILAGVFIYSGEYFWLWLVLAMVFAIIVRNLQPRTFPITGTNETSANTRSVAMNANNSSSSVPDEAVSHHPLVRVVKNANAFHAWLGAVVLTTVGVILFQILAGFTEIGDGLDIQGITIPWYVFAFPFAYLLYKYQSWVTLTRPRGFWYGMLDFIPSLAIAVITTVAALSWIPTFGDFMDGHAVPVADFDVTNVVLIAVFGTLSYWDLVVNHWRRAKYGREVAFSNMPFGLDSGLLTDRAIEVPVRVVLRPYVMVGGQRMFLRPTPPLIEGVAQHVADDVRAEAAHDASDVHPASAGHADGGAT
jgi:hypothetical protein